MAVNLFSETGQMQEVVDIPDIFDVLEGGEDEGAVKYLLGFGGPGGNGGGATAGQVATTLTGEQVILEEGEYIQTPGQQGVEIIPMTSDMVVVTTQAPGAAVTTVAGGGVPSESVTPSPSAGSSSKVSPSGEAHVVRKRDTSGMKAIYACSCCGKAFTTKFNLKRHINMHCHLSKEAGVPVQGPPSANAPPTKKPITNRIPKPNAPHKVRNTPKPVLCLPLTLPQQTSPSTGLPIPAIQTMANTAEGGTNAAQPARPASSSSDESEESQSSIPTVSVRYHHPQQQQQVVSQPSTVSPQLRTLIQSSLGEESAISPTPSLNLSPTTLTGMTALPMLPQQDLPQGSSQARSSTTVRPLTVITASPSGVTPTAPNVGVAATGAAPIIADLISGGSHAANSTLAPTVVTTTARPARSNPSAIPIPLLQTVQEAAAKVIQLSGNSLPSSFSVSVTVSPQALTSLTASNVVSEPMTLGGESTSMVSASNSNVIITSSILPQELFDDDSLPDGEADRAALTVAEDTDEEDSKSVVIKIEDLPLEEQKELLAETVTHVPAGWVRKVRPAPKRLPPAEVLYFSPAGKKFASETELRAYYARQGSYLVEGVFDFRLTEEECEECEMKVRRERAERRLEERLRVDAMRRG